MQKLVCPACNADIPAGNMNVTETIAVCPNCDTVFDFSFISEDKEKKPEKRRPIAPPKHISVRDTDDGFEIVRTWFEPAAIFLIFFTIFWNGFVFGFARVMFGSTMDIPFPFRLIPLVHLAVGVWLIYYTLSLLLNRTRVHVSFGGTITVRTYPLPYPWKDKTLAANQIEQLYVKKNVSYTNKGRRVTYDLIARLSDVSDETLVGGLSSADFALYVEQELENHLNIENQAVRGEYAGH